MKLLVPLAIGFFAAIEASGQGTVVFRNLESTNYCFRTNRGDPGPNLMSGANAYRIGLFASTNLTANQWSLPLVGLATNSSAFPGRFVGSAAHVLPNGFSPGTPIRFQLRVWSFAGGFTWEQAIVAAEADPVSIKVAVSPLGTITPGDDASPGALFGTNAGQLSAGIEIGGLGYPPVLRHIPSGLSLISVPHWLNSNSNMLAELLPEVPDGTQLYKLLRNAGSSRWSINQFRGGQWSRPEERLKPGEGAFIRNPSSGFQVTFSGGSSSQRGEPLVPGPNLIGLLWPSPSAPNAPFDFPPMDGDTISLWNGNDYGASYLYVQNLGWVDSQLNIVIPPVPRDAGFLYFRNGPGYSDFPPRTLFFHNDIPAAPLNSPITTTLGCVGTNLVAQLWAKEFPGNLLVPLGEPVPVKESGYLDTQRDLAVQVGNQYSGAVRVRVWDQRAGNFASAQSASMMWGQSTEFSLASVVNESHPPANIPQFASEIGPLAPFPIQSSPTNTSVLAGSAAQFSLTMMAILGDTTFQWQREDTGGPGSPPTLIWSNIPGATNTSLNLPAVTLADAGRYRVVITYGCTNRIVPSVSLDVIPFEFSRSAMREGDSVFTFSVSSEAGRHYQLFSSDDLETWTPGPIYSNTPAQWSLQLTNAGTKRFFRLALTP